jgi:tetratricopeptide (TPR) repeat protein
VPIEVDADIIEPGSVEIFEPSSAPTDSAPPEPVPVAPIAAAPKPEIIEPAPGNVTPPPLAPPPTPRHGVSSASDRIYALWESKQHAVVEREATAALERGGLSAGETARLWGLTGLARQAQDDIDGARGAFEEAIMAAPVEDRPAWQRHMAQLALHAGQALLARVQSGAGDPDERIDTLRAAIAWFESGITVAAADETLRDALRTARSVLWPTYEEAVNALLQRQEFHVARRLLREAQADEDCPPTVQASFREMLAATFGGEVGQLTAEAIRRMQEGKEEECLATLDRAETLLGTIPEEGIAPKRRQELERRLWWGYTKLGIKRVDGGMWEEALEPLLRALGFQGVGADRQEETRGPLVRALEGIVEARSPLIQRLTDDGDRDGALLLCEKLWTFLRMAMERGIGKDEMGPALGKTQEMFERLGKRKP